VVHGLQRTALRQKLRCEHPPRWPTVGARLGLRWLSPHLALDAPISNLLFSSDALEPSHGHVVARADEQCQHGVRARVVRLGGRTLHPLHKRLNRETQGSLPS